MALEIFRAISNLRLVLETETDYDSPDNELTYKAIREMIEILYQLTLDTGDSGTATGNPTETTLTDYFKSYSVDEHNGRTLVICSGNAKGNFYTIDDTTATTIVCTGDTLLADGVLSGDDYKILYDIKTHTSGHNHNGVNSASATVADGQITAAKLASSAVTQTKLKTSLGSVNHNSTTLTLKTLPGGSYGFREQYKMTNTFSGAWEGHPLKADAGFAGWTTYATTVGLKSAGGPKVLYAQQRYVTSSGEVFWIFILRDKATKEISSVWQAPDHPCFGNGGKPQLVPHPFPGYDDTKDEIIVINPSKEKVLEMKRKTIVESETEPDRDMIDVILEDYDLDETTEPNWPTEKVTVGLPPDWEEKAMGDSIVPIRKVIPRPVYIKTAALKFKQIKGVEL